MSRRDDAGKILVIRGGALGDFILTLPVLAALQGRFPNKTLEILGYERVASMAVAAGLASRVSALESPHLAGFFARDGAWPSRVSEYFAGFDLIVSYAHDPETTFQANVSRCSAAQFLAGPHRPDDSGQCHATQTLLRPLSILGLSEADARPRLNLPGPVEPSADKRLAVHPGSGSPRKNWPEAKWANLLQRLAAETCWHFMLIGGEAEGTRCERLAALLPPPRAHLARNFPLVELAQRMRSCAAFIGHDSGVTHLAAALGLPGLVLWGPSNATVWRPLSDRMRLLGDERGLDALPVQTVFDQTQLLLQSCYAGASAFNSWNENENGKNNRLNKPMPRIFPTLLAVIAVTATDTFGTEFKYAIAPHFFEQNPGGQPLGPCHGEALMDKAGQIYFSTDTPRGVLVFSPEGKFIRAFGPTHVHGMQIHVENGVEYFYGARPDYHDVVKFKMDGSLEWTIHYPPQAGIYKDENGFRPCAVTVGPDGSIFVADGYGANYVLKFDPDRKFVKAFGGPGKEEGKFSTCHGIGLDTRLDRPLLFICNRANNRVEYWDLDGNFVKIIRSDLRLPSKVSFHGDYAVIAELQGRVTVLDKAGNIVAQVGDNPNEKQRANYNVPPDQWKDGICNAPHGAFMDDHGDLIVTEWSKYGHLHKFTREK